MTPTKLCCNGCKKPMAHMIESDGRYWVQVSTQVAGEKMLCPDCTPSDIQIEVQKRHGAGRAMDNATVITSLIENETKGVKS